MISVPGRATSSLPVAGPSRALSSPVLDVPVDLRKDSDFEASYFLACVATNEGRSNAVPPLPKLEPREAVASTSAGVRSMPHLGKPFSLNPFSMDDGSASNSSGATEVHSCSAHADDRGREGDLSLNAVASSAPVDIDKCGKLFFSQFGFPVSH